MHGSYKFSFQSVDSYLAVLLTMLFTGHDKSECSSMIHLKVETVLTPTYFLIRPNVPSRSVS